MARCKVGVIFGSRSVEHEVSIITSHQVMEALDRNKYEVIPIYITKDGEWITGKRLFDLNSFKDPALTLPRCKKAFITPDPRTCFLVKPFDIIGWFRRKMFTYLDVVFPLVHGTHGEDGTLQGLLELANIPYVGAGVLGSAVGMDKIIMKSVFRDNGLPIVNYVGFSRKEWESHPEEIVRRIEANLKYPVFVKPSNLGSSIGITKSKNRGDLKSAIDVASHYDRRLIVEEGLDNLMEINCSVLGNDDPIASVCEQSISWRGFLGYEDKYLHGDKTHGLKDARRRIPAPISSTLTAEIQRLAIKAFKVVDCRGIARVDFLIDTKNETLFINEINTIPGSISFYLWEPVGIKFSELVERLIELALEVHREKNRITYSYDSNILKQHGA